MNIRQTLLMALAMLPFSGMAQGSEKTVHPTSATKTITVPGGVKYMGLFKEGLACVGSEQGKWFVINKRGVKVCDFPEGYRPAQVDDFGKVRDNAVVFDHGRMMIIQSAKGYELNAAVMDNMGRIVKHLGTVHRASPFINGLSVIEVSQNHSRVPWHVDLNGVIVSKTLPAENATVYGLNGNRRLFYDNEKKAYGYIDSLCNTVIPVRYKQAKGFSENLAWVKNDDGVWGAIDSLGRMVIEPMFSNKPENFYGGYALVFDKQGREHFVNTQGKIVWSNPRPGSGDEIRDFWKAGDKFYTIWTVDGKNYIVNTQFQRVASFNGEIPGEIVNTYPTGFHWRWDNNDNRFFDWQGRLLLNFEGWPMGWFSEGLCPHEDGYINMQGEIIVRFADTQF